MREREKVTQIAGPKVSQKALHLNFKFAPSSQKKVLHMKKQ